MTYLTDESVDRVIVQSLREASYDISYVAELWPGIADSEVLQHAQANRSVLLTGDKDFGELVFRRGAGTEGVLPFRLSGLPQRDKASSALEAFRRYAPRFEQAFTVVQRGRVRVRRR